MSFNKFQGMPNTQTLTIKYKGFLIVTIILLIGHISANAKAQSINRNIYWGMTPEQVRKAESWEFMNETEDGSLAYSGNLLGYECLVLYNFDADRLILAGYEKIGRARESDFLRDLKLKIISEYGEPIKTPADTFAMSTTPVLASSYYCVMLQIKLDFCVALISYKLGCPKGGVHVEEA